MLIAIVLLIAAILLATLAYLPSRRLSWIRRPIEWVLAIPLVITVIALTIVSEGREGVDELRTW